MSWASEAEIQERRHEETVPTYDFRIYDESVNEEGSSFARVDLIERGQVVSTESFFHSFDDPPLISAYGGGGADSLARSFAWAWVESMERSLEERFAPFGPEWEREMELMAAGVPG